MIGHYSYFNCNGPTGIEVEADFAHDSYASVKSIFFFLGGGGGRGGWEVGNAGNNQRLGSALDDLDPRLSFLYQVGDCHPPQQKIRGMSDTHAKNDPFIH